MPSIKVVIYGPKESGKTSLIRKIVYHESAEELRNIPPTVLIQHIRDFKYDRFSCSFFDCGGQLKFFERYNNEFATQVFRKVTLFFYIVDSRMYFEEDYRNELDEGHSNQDALHIARERYKKVAQKEFWRSIYNLYHHSGETIKLMVILANKKDLSDSLSPEIVKQSLGEKPTRAIIPEIDKFYKDVRKIISSMPVFATSILDASELSGLSSGEKVVFSFMDKLNEILPEQKDINEKHEEIRGLLFAANKKNDFIGSLFVNVEEPGLSISAMKKPDEIRSYIWEVEIGSRGILGQLGDKSIPEAIFIVGERYYVKILQLSKVHRLIVVFNRNAKNLEQKFEQIFATGEQLKSLNFVSVN